MRLIDLVVFNPQHRPVTWETVAITIILDVVATVVWRALT